jgi:hypothetical protein
MAKDMTRADLENGIALAIESLEEANKLKGAPRSEAMAIIQTHILLLITKILVQGVVK